jgi:hypothetical protein
MKSVEQRIKDTQAKLKQLREQARKHDARKKFEEAKQQRAVETRRKILIGALIWDSAVRSEGELSALLSRLNSYLRRADDRLLFGLAPIGIESQEDRQA